jgi:hypothetical protein
VVRTAAAAGPDISIIVIHALLDYRMLPAGLQMQLLLTALHYVPDESQSAHMLQLARSNSIMLIVPRPHPTSRHMARQQLGFSRLARRQQQPHHGEHRMRAG